MNITVKTLPKSEVKITIEVPESRTEKLLEKAAMQVSEHIKIPGFRAGHVPLDILKQHVSEEAIFNHMLDLALPETYSEAIVKEKIQVVSRPRINIVKKSPLTYEATVAVYPKVEISGYDKMKIKKEEPKVEEKDVEEVLKDIQKRHATYKEADRAAKTGDRVEIDFEGYDEGGALLEKTQSKNHPLIIGEGSLVKGFEEELTGMKKGEKKSFKVQFPKDYFHKPFQGKTVEFKVEMKKVEDVQTPEWTPEFIKQIVAQDKSLDELKQIIRENLQHDKNHGEKVRRENEFLENIIKLTKLDIPEILIEEEIDAMIEEFKDELGKSGIPFETFLEQNKKDLKTMRQERRKEAEKRLTLRFGLQELFQKEKFEVTPDELKKEIEHVINLYPAKEQDKIRKEYKEGSYLLRRLENKMKMEKVFERFLEK